MTLFAADGSFPLALMAVYAQFVSHVLVESLDFPGCLGVAHLAVLEGFLVHFVRKLDITHFRGKSDYILRHSKSGHKTYERKR
jgi:hypothetical protein